jgi:dCTP deaminase
MGFWSGEKLAQELKLRSLIDKFKPENVDCASYQLCVGEHVFATSDKFAASAPTEALVSTLQTDPPHNLLRIKPGQFAFLMTEEVVKVPSDAIALISIRAGYKFKGLINVSGFHVDPGWEGKLLFSVYNAGPAEVIVERGQPMFLIVYADLDRVSEKVYTGESKGQKNIKGSLLQNMTEQVFSPLMLQRRIEDLSREMGAVERSVAISKAVSFSISSIAAILVAAIALFATFAPSTLGVILAMTIKSAGFDVKLKSDELPVLSSCSTASPVVSSKPPAENPSSKP